MSANFETRGLDHIFESTLGAPKICFCDCVHVFEDISPKFAGDHLWTPGQTWVSLA